jgi:serine phosphatase RsbU (regulator of sigma subunit)/uncharacterized membrane protein affecting hemolysin expression
MDLEQALQREAELLTRNAAASAASLLATSDYTRLDEIVKNLSTENRNVVWIALVEASGTVAAASSGAPAKQGGKIGDALSAKLAGLGSGKVVQMTDPSNASHLLLGTPVFVTDSTGKESHVGMVRIAFDMSAMERAKQDVIASGRARAKESAEKQLLFAALLLAIGLLLGAWQSMRISRPLLALSEQAKHIASGDFSRRVPVTRGDEVGQLGESFNKMSESLVSLVEEIGRKASLEREMEVARSIQNLMVPPPDQVSMGDYRLIGRCEMASACGGDWWSYRKLNDGRLLVVVGDVTGHGMPSAMIAATGRGAVESLAFVAHETLTPALVLEAIDRAIRDVGDRLLMTCFAMIVSPDGTVHYANAAHTFPYVVCDIKGENPGLEVLSVRSNPLGSGRPMIADGTHHLSHGDMMILTSDGLTDRVSSDGNRFGEKRLRLTLLNEAVRGTDDVKVMAQRIADAVNDFGGAQPVDDDITLVVLKYMGGGAGGTRERVRTSRRMQVIKRGSAA